MFRQEMTQLPPIKRWISQELFETSFTAGFVEKRYRSTVEFIDGTTADVYEFSRVDQASGSQVLYHVWKVGQE